MHDIVNRLIYRRYIKVEMAALEWVQLNSCANIRGLEKNSLLFKYKGHDTALNDQACPSKVYNDVTITTYLLLSTWYTVLSNKLFCLWSRWLTSVSLVFLTQNCLIYYFQHSFSSMLTFNIFGFFSLSIV